MARRPAPTQGGFVSPRYGPIVSQTQGGQILHRGEVRGHPAGHSAPAFSAQIPRKSCCIIEWHLALVPLRYSKEGLRESIRSPFFCCEGVGQCSLRKEGY